MNIWDHCRLSVRKFGGIEEDYFQIHKLLDSSKFFYHHFKHRLVLHHLYGVEIAIEKFGDYIQNQDGETLLVRDIAVEHLKEDLNGHVPTLHEWLVDNDEELSQRISIPNIEDQQLKAFVMKPMLMSNLKSSLLITLSDFGIYLCNELLGLDQALTLQKLVDKEYTIKSYLDHFKITQKWQFTPDRQEIKWLKTNKNDNKSTIKRIDYPNAASR